jgi:hypothetical protein
MKKSLQEVLAVHVDRTRRERNAIRRLVNSALSSLPPELLPQFHDQLRELLQALSSKNGGSNA